MNKRSFHIGPGAASILLIVVLLSMSVLGMLSLMNARSDAQLSDRSAFVAEAVYRLNTRAEEQLAELDTVLAECAAAADEDADYLSKVEARLPDGMSLTEDTVAWIVNDSEGRTLDCSVRLTPAGTMPRFVWTKHSLITEYAEDTQQEWQFWGV